MTISALEAATTTRVDCGAADSEKAPAQARQATRTNERMGPSMSFMPELRHQGHPKEMNLRGRVETTPQNCLLGQPALGLLITEHIPRMCQGDEFTKIQTNCLACCAAKDFMSVANPEKG
jgi:hypothetical protein